MAKERSKRRNSPSRKAGVKHQAGGITISGGDADHLTVPAGDVPCDVSPDDTARALNKAPEASADTDKLPPRPVVAVAGADDPADTATLCFNVGRFVLPVRTLAIMATRHDTSMHGLPDLYDVLMPSVNSPAIVKDLCDGVLAGRDLITVTNAMVALTPVRVWAAKRKLMVAVAEVAGRFEVTVTPMV
ncbi:MAG: hypothetical protein IT464_12660 [Planctomycetes bacterium]|nr:hypothetical protein [Planctomycetota bacterium]